MLIILKESQPLIMSLISLGLQYHVHPTVITYPSHVLVYLFMFMSKDAKVPILLVVV